MTLDSYFPNPQPPDENDPREPNQPEEYTDKPTEKTILRSNQQQSEISVDLPEVPREPIVRPDQQQEIPEITTEISREPIEIPESPIEIPKESAEKTDESTDVTEEPTERPEVPEGIPEEPSVRPQESSVGSEEPLKTLDGFTGKSEEPDENREQPMGMPEEHTVKIEGYTELPEEHTEIIEESKRVDVTERTNNANRSPTNNFLPRFRIQPNKTYTHRKQSITKETNIYLDNNSQEIISMLNLNIT